MKTIIFILVLVVTSTAAFSQVEGEKKVLVNDVNINELPDVHYVALVGQTVLFSQKVTVYVQYGQQVKMGDDQRIQGPDGKVQKFFGMVDALNFMYKNGWQSIGSTVTLAGNQYVYHNMMERKKE